MRGRQSYFSLLGKFSLKRILKVWDLSNSQTSDEDQRGRRNPLFHKCRQWQQEPDDDVYPPGQDDQEL